MSVPTATTSTKGTIYFDEPPVARTLFASTKFAWLWLILRLYLGWEWFVAGWGKTFGGNITWKVWNWGDDQYSLTGNANCGWVRSCVVEGQPVARGAAVQGFAAGAVENSKGPHPDVAYSWYVNFLEWVRDHAYSWLGPLVAIGELVVGVLLIIGLFTGIAAALGATMNFSYIFAGTAGVNPLYIIISGILILAWRVAGWYGLDRWVLRKLGTPWQPGTAFTRDTSPPAERPLDEVDAPAPPPTPPPSPTSP
jgi:thiosulfate dehydrogenase [quinone] large subunit